MTKTKPVYLTTTQAAKDANVSRQIIVYHITEGNLKAEQIGQAYLITREEWERFKSNWPKRTGRPSKN